MAITKELLDSLAAVDTPTICNALELAVPGRRGHGYTSRPFVCAHPGLRPIVGIARTGSLRARHAADPGQGDQRILRLDYYDYVAAADLPTITVLQDLDPEPGYGAFWGEVNTAVHKWLGCIGCITNGSIRDLDAIAPGFQLLAGSLAPSHAFVRIERFDLPVTVHGMEVAPGDLIHADRHGAVVIPASVAAELPAAIELCTRREAPILSAARAPGFTVAKLREAMGAADDIH